MCIAQLMPFVKYLSLLLSYKTRMDKREKKVYHFYYNMVDLEDKGYIVDLFCADSLTYRCGQLCRKPWSHIVDLCYALYKVVISPLALYSNSHIPPSSVRVTSCR